MKRSTIAVLWSALALPGAGHLYLKKHRPGIALAVVALAAVSYITVKTVEKTLKVYSRLLDGELDLEPGAILEYLNTLSNPDEALLINICTVVFIVCWIVAILDSYRLGKDDPGRR